MYANGITRFGLRAGDIERVSILLPSPPEQRKIAAILSSVDGAIEKTQAVIDHVQVVKRGLMQELLTRGLPGRHTRFKQTEIGEIPAKWKVVHLQELCSHIVDCLHRTPPYADEGYPAIRTSDLVAGRLLLDKAKRVSRNTYLEQIARLEPMPSDILYSREGSFGLAAPVPPGVKLCISQRMMHFRAGPGVDPLFLMWLLNSRTVYRQAVDSVGGSTVGHVNIRSIRKFRVPLPDRREQSQLAVILQAVSQYEVASEEALVGPSNGKSSPSVRPPHRRAPRHSRPRGSIISNTTGGMNCNSRKTSGSSLGGSPDWVLTRPLWWRAQRCAAELQACPPDHETY